MVRRRYVAAVVALVFTLSSVHSSQALELNLPASLEETTDFKMQPLAILSKFPSAGPSMASFVANVLKKQPGIIDSVLSIIPDTSPEQASAIGAGIVRAVRSLASKHPDLVAQISDKIMRSENLTLKTTYFALGPRRITYASAEPSLPLPDSVRYGGGGAVGMALPTDKAKLGSPEVPYVFPGFVNKDEAVVDKKRIGMIVALVVSNASSNGAVSTSPH